MPTTAEFLPDPVAAYDRLAPHFAQVAGRRARYLQGVEDLIVARIPAGARSLLDVGAGDGMRAARLARRAGLRDIVLIEPSLEMRRAVPSGVEVWPARAEALSAEDPLARGRSFDAITCLWNVLGHVRPEAMRVRALGEMGRLVAPGGRLFLDLTHRYNARSYGFARTVARALRDAFSFSERSGDVVASWAAGESRCSTYGHVFTDVEARRIASRAGLVILDRLVVDYDTGEERRWALSGNLLYVMRRRDEAVSSGSRPATGRPGG